MAGATVEITTPEGVADAYLTGHEGEPGPGVLLVMDAFGLRPTIRAMADRIAAGGYTVLAPNVFYRAGRSPVPPAPDLSDPERRTAFFQTLRPLMDELTPERLAADGGAYLDRLGEAAAPSAPVAIAGYCMGGRVGWRIAAAHPGRVAALAGFHVGGLATDAPDSPHLSADRLTAELYLGFADRDPNATPEQIATLERALAGAGVRHTIEVYEGALHGYTMADQAVYDEAAAERHYRELGSLLERTIG